MRPIALLVAAVLAGVVTLWVVARGVGDPEGDAPEGAGPPGSPWASTSPAEVGPGLSERGDPETPRLGRSPSTPASARVERGRSPPSSARATARPEAAGTRSVGLRVRDAAGQVVPRARANLVHGRFSAYADVADGVATRLVDDRPGDVVVQVWAARAADGSPLPLGWAWGTLDPASGEVDLRLPREQVVAGTVRRPDGRGIPDVVVRARPVHEAFDGHSGRRVETTATSDADGGFRLERIGEGEVRVAVDPPPEFQPAAPVLVRPPAETVRLVLLPAFAPVVTVLDPDDRPVPGALVSATWVRGGAQPHEGGVAGGEPTDREGRFRIPGLRPEATYRLRVLPPALRTDVVEAVLADWTPKDAVVRLAPGHSVVGRVVDLGGRPVADVNLYFRTDPPVGVGWSSENVGVGADGTFRITNLPAGTVTLRATTRGDGVAKREDGDPTIGEAVVAAGAEGVVIRIDPGITLTVRLEDSVPRASREAVLLCEGGRGGRGVHVGKRVRPDGTVRWAGLDPGMRCSLVVLPAADDLSYVKRDLVPTGEPVVVRLERGLPITGVLELPPDATRVRVRAAFGAMSAYVYGKVSPGGHYEIVGVPRGTWRVESWCDTPAGSFVATPVDVEAGGTADLVLEKAR